MTDLEIPNEIRGKAADALYAARDRGLGMNQGAACVLHDTAPLVVAAELRRLADQLSVTAAEWREEDDRTIRSSALGYAVRVLRARADELDGGA